MSDDKKLKYLVQLLTPVVEYEIILSNLGPIHAREYFKTLWPDAKNVVEVYAQLYHLEERDFDSLDEFTSGFLNENPLPSKPTCSPDRAVVNIHRNMLITMLPDLETAIKAEDKAEILDVYEYTSRVDVDLLDDAGYTDILKKYFKLMDQAIKILFVSPEKNPNNP